MIVRLTSKGRALRVDAGEVITCIGQAVGMEAGEIAALMQRMRCLRDKLEQAAA